MVSATQIRNARAARLRLRFASGITELPPPIRKAIEQDRAQGLGWRHDGLTTWSTNDIFRKLHEAQVDTDEARLREQAMESSGVCALTDLWLTRQPLAGPWAEFPLLAAEELWFRLLRDLDCPEIVSRRLDDAILAGSQDNIQVPVDDSQRRHLWEGIMRFWHYITQGEPSNWPSRYADAQAFSPVDYEIVMLDLIKQASAQELDQASRCAAHLVQVKPSALPLAYLGIALARAGRSVEAQQAIANNIAQHSEQAWAQETAGEVYLTLGNSAQAVECFRSALRSAESALEWGALLDHMCTAVATCAADPNTVGKLSESLDRIAMDIEPPDD